MTGLLVTLDSPGGTGKTTTAVMAAAELGRRGQAAHVTAEPSRGPVGTLARSLVNEATGTRWRAWSPPTATTTSRPRFGHGSPPGTSSATVTWPRPWSCRAATASRSPGSWPSRAR